MARINHDPFLQKYKDTTFLPTCRLIQDKYEELRCHIKALFERSHKTYGYRRIHALLKQENICISEKVVRPQ